MDTDYNTILKGTTYRVYRYILKQRKPVGISDVQKSLGLSSSSVSEYHIKKLLKVGLIREEQGGYIVDKVVFENVIRIRRVALPAQTAYVFFFATTLLLFLILRPKDLDSIYFLAIVVNAVAFSISVYDLAKTMKRL